MFGRLLISSKCYTYGIFFLPNMLNLQAISLHGQIMEVHAFTFTNTPLISVGRAPRFVRVTLSESITVDGLVDEKKNHSGLV